MSLIQGVFFGIGMLILAYLAFNNAGGVANIMDAAASGISSTSRVLQGRKAS